MFLLDNLLLGPGKAAMMVFKELARKAQEDWLDDEAVKQELQEIYALVEAGNISTQEFEARECRLLERLEQIAKAKFKDKWGTSEMQASAMLGTSLADEGGSSESSMAELLPPSAVVVDPESRRPQIELTHTVRPLWPSEPPLEMPAALPVLPAPVALPPVATTVAAPSSIPIVQAPLPPATPAPSPIAAMPIAVAEPLASMPTTGPMSLGQVVQSATRALALLNLKVSAITSVSPSEDGWRVTAELLERRGVPDTSDVLGIYELRLDAAGNVMRYERTRMRRRGDLGR